MREAVDGLRLGIDGPVATLTIDRPQKRNALARRHWDALPGLVEKAAGSRVLVLTGAGDTFCAGADISEFASERAAGPKARSYEAANERAFAALAEAPVPTVALVRGAAIGGGFGLAAACDLRFATPDAVFAVPAARLGLAYPVRAMDRIVESVGAMRARQMLLTAARFDAATMERWGFLTEVVTQTSVAELLSRTIDAIAANAPLTLRAARAAISRGDDASALADATFESDDYTEGVAAFAARRTPRFTGA